MQGQSLVVLLRKGQLSSNYWVDILKPRGMGGDGIEMLASQSMC